MRNISCSSKTSQQMFRDKDLTKRNRASNVANPRKFENKVLPTDNPKFGFPQFMRPFIERVKTIIDMIFPRSPKVLTIVNKMPSP